MRYIKLSLIVILLSMIIMMTPTAHASSATSYTMTINAKGEYVRTQDAYLPNATIISLNLKAPEDMMIDDQDHIWITDTGNKRIVTYDPSTDQMIQEITYEGFKRPRGIYLSESSIYVADSVAEAIFVFDYAGNLIQTYHRPDSPSFADTPFNPSKLVVDNRGNIYIYGEGVKNGIIQLSNTGEFLGFFTSNKVELSAMQQLYKLIFSDEQFDNFAVRDPSNFSSLFIDNESIIYTTTMGTFRHAIKKHNTQGGNIFTERTISYDDARDIYVDDQGIVYAGMQNGTIFVYTPDGEFIFNFGANNQSLGAAVADVSGLFSRLAAIAIDSNGYIWALDDQKNFLQSFNPTDYALKIYSAIELYEGRYYDQAIVVWNEVLNLNQMSVIAHNSIAKSYLQQENYEEAMTHFELAGNREGYSEASWEVRNIGIQNALGGVIIAVIATYVLYMTLVIVNKKTGKITLALAPVKSVFQRKKVADMFYFFKVMRHPMDSFYDMRKGYHTTIWSALALYIILFISFILYSTAKGFIYQFVAAEDMDLTALVLGFFSITLIFVFSNYLVTSIYDGMGTIKEIFIMFVYATGPMLLAFISTTILSHMLTYNETFFLDFIMYVGYGWTAILLFLGIIEIHGYMGKQAFKSILLTLLFAIIIAIVLILVIMMWSQLYSFLEVIFKEVFRNVFR